MRGRSKVKLSLIANPSIRKATFKKRKKGLLKKLYELSTLCDVRACAVISSPFEPTPAVWPSTQGVEEVASMFMELPETARCKNMLTHETYLRERITKQQEKVRKLSKENRESELRQIMFDLMEGKTNLHQCDPRDCQDLSFFIHDYINMLNARVKFLTDYGEASSLPPFPATFTDANPPVVADEGYGQFQYHNMNQNMHEPVQYHAPIGLNDQIQYQHEPVQHHVSNAFNDQIQYQNMNQNQHESVQYHAPTGFNDQIQNQNIYMNQNQYEPVQYHAPTGLSDQIQYQNMNMNQNQYEPVQYQNMNQYQHEPVQYQPQEMGYVGEHAHFPFMDDYIQLLTGDVATTSLMPFIPTTAAATVGVHAPPYINNNL